MGERRLCFSCSTSTSTSAFSCSIVVWYNWSIVYKLSFKRRHNGEIIIAYHPIQDLIATGSWDHTVLMNSIITQTASMNESKAKRVLDHHYNINSIAFHKTQFDIIAVAG